MLNPKRNHLYIKKVHRSELFWLKYSSKYEKCTLCWLKCNKNCLINFEINWFQITFVFDHMALIPSFIRELTHNGRIWIRLKSRARKTIGVKCIRVVCPINPMNLIGVYSIIHEFFNVQLVILKPINRSNEMLSDRFNQNNEIHGWRRGDRRGLDGRVDGFWGYLRLWCFTFWPRLMYSRMY